MHKKVIAFDLDGTLAESKMSIDAEMAELLITLLEKKIVAVIGGATLELFEKQFLSSLSHRKDLFTNLLLLPTSGAAFCVFENDEWKMVHQDILSPEEREKVKQSIMQALKDINFTIPEKLYGPIIEDRGTEVTFSPLGMETPLDIKQEWHANHDIRKPLIEALANYIPEFEVRLGGLTSLDITKRGINKAHGIEQIVERLSVTIDEITYVGDALYEDGNDAAVIPTGVETTQVASPEETKQLIRNILATVA